MKWTLLSVLAFLNFCVFGQTIPTTVNFKTPEVAAINKFIETPVSYYTGVPAISIPLYEINIKGVTVPIVLNYNAGGIRVDEEATWVGLGWSLAYGGQISRKVRGIEDEKYFLLGATNSAFSVNHITQLPGINEDGFLTDRYDYLYAAKTGHTDYMPDEFYYSALGYSGRFMFSQKNNKFVLFPKEDISVQQYPTLPNEQGSTFPFYYWNLQLPDGTAVQFGKDGINSQMDLSTATNWVKNAWQIKGIQNVYNESIDYTYENSTYQMYKIAGQRLEFDNISGSALTNNLAHLSYNDPILKSISFPNGKINFITEDRADMPNQRLAEIDVLDNKNNLIRKIVFRYSYFYANSFDIMSTLGQENLVTNPYRFNRLRLDGISISGSNSTSSQDYTFDYYTNAHMPSKFSFSQDHWGYFNGMGNMSIYSFLPDKAPSLYQGGDRRVKPENSNVFTLKSIKYPEGGKVEYEYEGNTADISSMPNFFLDMMQDDNLIEHSAIINFSGFSRSSLFPSPDIIDANGNKFYKKQFTIPAGTYACVGYSWLVSTNYGISNLEVTTPYGADNVDFLLEAINPDGTRTTIKEFNTTPQNTNPIIRNGIDNGYAAPLYAGNYEMTVRVNYLNQPNSPADNQPHTTNFSIKWRQFNPDTKALNVGGLRIKSIKYYSSDSVLARQKAYAYVHPFSDGSMPTHTSGRVISLPQYYQAQMQRSTDQNGQPQIRWKDIITSNSYHPLETTSGSYCGYEYVDEIDVDNTNAGNNLKKSFQFEFTRPNFSEYFNYLNLAEWEPQEWKRGKLIQAKYYKGDNIIKQEDYEYNDWSPHLSGESAEDYVEEINTDLISYQYFQRVSLAGSTSVFPADFYEVDPNQISGGPYGRVYTHCIFWHYGLANYHVNPIPGDVAIGDPCFGDVVLPYFVRHTGFDKPKSKMTTTKDDSGNSMVAVENYFYDKTPDLNQMTRSETVNSKHETIKSQTKYPIDFSTALPYSSMLQRHMLNTPLEVSMYKDGGFLTSSRTNYFDWGNNIIAPVTVESTIGNSPTYTKARFYGYDDRCNILSVGKEKDYHLSYLYDYNKEYPIAQVVNASNDQIAYTSFEGDGNGNWTIGSALRNLEAITGKQSYDLNNGSIAKSGLDTAKSYIISWWNKPAATVQINGSSYGKQLAQRNGWIYQEAVINGISSVTISGSGLVDEIRLYPADAQMTTYTYDPLVGMTSQCDINSRVTYYEYDAQNRLSLIRDQDKNILKKICYNYAGQPEDCYIGASCSAFNCAGPDKKCVTGTCQTGIKIYTSSTRMDTNVYTCVYHYEFSDGSSSGSFTETSSSFCPITITNN